MSDNQDITQPSKTDVSAVQCHHDYNNPKRMGRFHYHCPKCDADISLDCFMIAEAMMGENEKRTPTR